MLLFCGYNNFFILPRILLRSILFLVYCSHFFQNYISYMFLLLTCSGFPQNTDRGFPNGSVAPPANAGASGDLGSIPGSGRSPREGNGNPVQNSCLENPTGGLYSPWGHKESDSTEPLSTNTKAWLTLHRSHLFRSRVLGSCVEVLGFEQGLSSEDLTVGWSAEALWLEDPIKIVRSLLGWWSIFQLSPWRV